jgi:hypothetical protein
MVFHAHRRKEAYEGWNGNRIIIIASPPDPPLHCSREGEQDKARERCEPKDAVRRLRRGSPPHRNGEGPGVRLPAALPYFAQALQRLNLGDDCQPIACLEHGFFRR